MEGSTGVAPAAADAGGQVQAPPSPLEQQAPAQPAAPDQGQQPSASPENDFATRLQEAEAEAAKARQELEQLQGGQPDDLLSALQGPEEDFGLSEEDLAAAQVGEQPGQMDPVDQQQQLAEFEGYVESVAQKMVSPIIEERQEEKVDAWQKDHPDVTPGSDLAKGIVATVQGLVQKYGNDNLIYDTNILDLAYTAAKAKSADAGAVPAEQVGADGASLETGAGQTQAGADSEADTYRKLLHGAADNPLA